MPDGVFQPRVEKNLVFEVLHHVLHFRGHDALGVQYPGFRTTFADATKAPFVLRTNSAGSTEETTQFHTTQPVEPAKAPLNYLSKRRHDARLHCVPTPSYAPAP